MSKLPSSVLTGKTTKSVIPADALHHGSSQHPDLAIYLSPSHFDGACFRKEHSTYDVLRIVHLLRVSRRAQLSCVP